jgi:cyclic-di-GMP phosphodiesterase TipF (flagellum assembly factor)
MTHTAAYGDDALDDPAEAGSGGWLPEIVVHLSMMIVIAALGMALRTSFGFGMVAAIAIALSVYWCLLVVHALVRRGKDAADLSEEVAQLADENAALRRLTGARRSPEMERELPRLGGLTGGMTGDRPPPRVLERSRAPEAARPKAPELPKPELPKAGPGPSKPVVSGPAPRASEPAKARPTPPPPPKPVAATAPPRNGNVAPPARGAIAPPARKPPPPPVATRMPPPPPARPRAQGLAALAAEKPVAKAPVEMPRESAEGEDPRAQDIAIMQSLIKGLADQINGPAAKIEAPRAPVAPEPRSEPVSEPMSDLVPELAEALVQASVEPALDDVPVEPMLDNIQQQVGALRDMADDMRDSLLPPSAESVASAGARSLHTQLEYALDAARIDVCVDPILGLDDRRARHFEVSVRLHSEGGEILDPRHFMGALAGTGLTPRIEALTFSETIRLAGEFAARGAAADLFSIASGESLRDGDFHAALGGALAPDTRLGARLVMSIPQEEVRAFGPAHWQALAALSEAGLRYALIDVVDLDMDFEALAAEGFEFVRLDADVFLQGLPAPHGIVPAADLCRHLSGFGFTLIVSRIGEERELAEVLGFGALLGQGRLFGGPRPIRQERPARHPSAA